MIVRAYVGDCLHIPLDDDSVDLCLTSPPYERGARRYKGLEFNLAGEEWVAWALPRALECLRVTRGLVAWVVGGRMRNRRWTAVPDLLSADLHRMGVNLLEPLYYVRRGTPGSGGDQWLRKDAEKVICMSKSPVLPWSDNTAYGSEPKAQDYVAKGGRPYRTAADEREDGDDIGRWGQRALRRAQRGGRAKRPTVPDRVNPGNLLAFGRGDSWGMGSRFAMQTEAPYPLWLATFFVRSFCRPGGVAMDPMCGSGTLAAAAVRHGRHAVIGDIRRSQINLSRRRLQAETQAEFTLLKGAERAATAV